MIGRRRTSLVLATSAAAFLCGCPVNITSEPSGARVVVDGVDRGRTPLKINLPFNISEDRDSGITLEHPGYHPMTARIRYRRLYEFTYPVLYAFLFRRPVENQHFVMAPLPSDRSADESPVPVGGGEEAPVPAGGGEEAPVPVAAEPRPAQDEVRTRGARIQP
ncbi:MAG: PEGA domain-containing protein [Planctomycetota bacterium]|jgi:hypothetical protein